MTVGDSRLYDVIDSDPEYDDYGTQPEAELPDNFFEQDGPGLFDAPQPPVNHEPPAEVAQVSQEEQVVPIDEDEEPAPPDQVTEMVEKTELQNQVEAVADEEDDAHLALYRRYRPDSFEEVIGQDHVTKPLMRAIENNKVNHAYLFSGPRGCGKTTSARILARCLNCEQGPTAHPCGVCQSCVDLATGGPGSIDVIEIDAASHGGVDDARELRERAFFAPVASRYKVYIVDEAHMVTPQGFNALLKLVEEPPPHVKFIFATTEPEKVIGTIRSRTHHYPFRLVPPRILTSYLEEICEAENVQVEKGVLPLVVRAGAGSVRDALSVLDQLLGAADKGEVSYQQAAGLLGYTPDALLDEIVDAFAAGDGKGVFKTIDKVIEVGQDPRRFAEDLLQRMRDLVIVAQVPDAISSGLIDVSDDQAQRLTSQAGALGAGEVTRAAEVFATGLTQMRGTTAPRLNLELICARVLLPAADNDDAGINARLDRIERRLDMPQMPARSGGRHSEPQHAQQAQPDQRKSPQGAAQPVQQRLAQHRPAQQTPVQQRPAAAEGSQPPAQQRPAQQRPAQQRPAPEQAAPQQRPAPQQAAPQPDSGSAHRGNQGQPAQQQAPQQRPAPQQHSAEQAAQQPSGARPDGEPLSVVDVRRLWPNVLEEVKRRKRFTHALLSQNASVVALEGGVLTLGFNSPGTLETYERGESQEVLLEALKSVIGADLRIKTVTNDGQQHSPRQESEEEDAEPISEAVVEGVSLDDEVIDDPTVSVDQLITSKLGGKLIFDDSDPDNNQVS